MDVECRVAVTLVGGDEARVCVFEHVFTCVSSN